MKSVVVLLPVLVFAVASAGAQQTATAPAVEMQGPGAQQANPPETPLNEQLKQRVAKLNQRLEILRASIPVCPVSMDVSQGGGLRVLRAKDGTVSKPGMMPTLTLRDPGGKHIVGASITARGLGAPKKAIPLETKAPAAMPDDGNDIVARPGDGFTISAQGRPVLKRTMDIAFEPWEREDTAEFSLPGFVMLTSIQLNSVTYEDGTTWEVPASQSCRAKPSPLMLVGGR